MPVAVDRTLDMGAFEGKTIGEVHVSELLPDTPQKTPRARKVRKPRAQATQDQPLAGSSTVVDESSWTWRSLTESSASSVQPIFTKDGSYFLSAAGPAVKIYSIATGNLVSTLSPLGTSSHPPVPTGYGDAITSMALNPHNAFQLYTSSLDGCIRVWDLIDAILMQTIDVEDPILQLAVHAQFKNEVFISISRRTKALNSNGNPTMDDNAVVQRVSLVPSKATEGLPIQKSSETRKVGKCRATHGLCLSPGGSWVVAIGGHKAYVAKTADLKSGFTKFVSPDKLTCLAFHPSEEYFATGDTKGVVRLWYCLNDGLPAGVSGVEKKAPTTTMHWHAHAVSSIAFTANGAYLLSGGEEAVLVIWQLHTGKKEFVPRVGAPIMAVTVSNHAEEKYLLGLADASFVFVRSGTFRISKTIARVKLDPGIAYDRSKMSSVPLAVHSLSTSLILPSSHPSTLQTYSPTTSKLLSEIEVSPSNRVSRRDEAPLEPCCVEMTCVSDGGDWMATVDARQGADVFGAEIYLKIWSWDKKAGLWTLNTRVDRPHGVKKVSSIAFRPAGKASLVESLVSTGEDGTVKVWGTRMAQSKSEQAEVFWVTRSTTRFRSEIPSHASWSLDGSLLAVTFGPYVVLYDPSSMLVVNTLTCPECPVVLSSHFVGRGGRYLALRGHRDLVLWDLITDSVRWHHRGFAISHVFAHHRDDSFVVFELQSQSKTRVLKFTPDSVVPTISHSLPFQLLSIVACPPRWMLTKDLSSFAFVGITAAWGVVLFGDRVRLAEDDQPEARGLGATEQVTKRTLFQDIFGKVALADVSAGKSASTNAPWKGKEVEKIFDTPSYLLPPLGTLFDPILDEFLSPRLPDDGADEHDEDNEVEMQQEDEMDAEGAQAPIIVGNRLERIVDGAEMAAMTELFQAHGLHAPKANPPSTNGPPRVNGHQGASAKLNGVGSPAPATPKAAKRAPQLNGVHPAVPSVPPSPQVVDSPAAKTGQKRKKSLG